MPADGTSQCATILLTAGISLLLIAALHDLVARTVPNLVSLLIAAAGFGLRALDGHLIAGLVAGLITFCVAAFCWRRGWMGGGDVKLLAAGAIFVPPMSVLTFVTAVSLAGAGLAVIYLAGRTIGSVPSGSRPAGLAARVARIERWRFGRGGPLPYACAIAAGGLFVLL